MRLDIDFFHCKEVVDVLKETDKDSKNIFGYYSSQRMKDWQEILSLYQRDNLFLAEAAQTLQRFIQFEIPAIRRGIQKAEQGIGEAQKKEADHGKQAENARGAYERELKKFGIKGEKVKRELFDLAKDLPLTFDQLAQEAGAFLDAITYFEDFQSYVLAVKDEAQPVDLLKRLAVKGKDMTVFEWKFGKAPVEVQRAELQFEEEKASGNSCSFHVSRR